MNAGAGCFSGGVEALQGGSPIEVGADAAHEVMGRGTNGDEVAGQVKAVFGQECADARKSLVQVDAFDMPHVQMARFAIRPGVPFLRGRWREPRHRAGPVQGKDDAAP